MRDTNLHSFIMAFHDFVKLHEGNKELRRIMRTQISSRLPICTTASRNWKCIEESPDCRENSLSLSGEETTPTRPTKKKKKKKGSTNLGVKKPSTKGKSVPSSSY